MENIIKKLSNNQYYFFPWGCLMITPIWFGVVKAIEWLIAKNEDLSLPGWVWMTLFLAVELCIVLFFFLYPRATPKGKDNHHNFFLLIYPEYLDDDKYITNDFVSAFRKQACGIRNLNVIVPSVARRRFFNKRIERSVKRGNDFWNSNVGKKKHKKMGGTVYITGTLLRRFSKNKEHFVFKLSLTIGYNDLNKNLTPIMKEDLRVNFPTHSLIDKQFEFEQFQLFSDRFATFTEFLIGWSLLVSGNLQQAYELHKDIIVNDKQSFFKQGNLKDLRGMLRFETITILKDCKLFPREIIDDCFSTILNLFYDNSEALLMLARGLIMTSSSDNIENNIFKALQVMSKVRVNKNNRAWFHANKAYLLLLSKKYDQAKQEYDLLFKHPEVSILKGIVDYCDEQIANGTDLERPAAYYVKVLMLIKLRADDDLITKARDEAHNCIPLDHYCHVLLNEL